MSGWIFILTIPMLAKYEGLARLGQPLVETGGIKISMRNLHLPRLTMQGSPRSKGKGLSNHEGDLFPGSERAGVKNFVLLDELLDAALHVHWSERGQC